MSPLALITDNSKQTTVNSSADVCQIETNNFDKLPDEMLLKIFNKLQLEDLNNINDTCHRFRKVLSDVKNIELNTKYLKKYLRRCSNIFRLRFNDIIQKKEIVVYENREINVKTIYDGLDSYDEDELNEFPDDFDDKYTNLVETNDGLTKIYYRNIKLLKPKNQFEKMINNVSGLVIDGTDYGDIYKYCRYFKNLKYFKTIDYKDNDYGYDKLDKLYGSKNTLEYLDLKSDYDIKFEFKFQNVKILKIFFDEEIEEFFPNLEHLTIYENLNCEKTEFNFIGRHRSAKIYDFLNKLKSITFETIFVSVDEIHTNIRYDDVSRNFHRLINYDDIYNSCENIYIKKIFKTEYIKFSGEYDIYKIIKLLDKINEIHFECGDNFNEFYKYLIDFTNYNFTINNDYIVFDKNYKKENIKYLELEKFSTRLLEENRSLSSNLKLTIEKTKDNTKFIKDKLYEIETKYNQDLNRMKNDNENLKDEYKDLEEEKTNLEKKYKLLDNKNNKYKDKNKKLIKDYNNLVDDYNENLKKIKNKDRIILKLKFPETKIEKIDKELIEKLIEIMNEDDFDIDRLTSVKVTSFTYNKYKYSIK